MTELNHARSVVWAVYFPLQDPETVVTTTTKNCLEKWGSWPPSSYGSAAPELSPPQG